MLEIEDLTVNFQNDQEEVCAVDSVSFSVADGETLAIVGESGSGKSVTALSLTKLIPQPPARIVRGEVFLDRQPLLSKTSGELRKIRGKQIAYIFQEPATSLNPVFSIYAQMLEVIRLHRPEIRDVRRETIFWLEQVGILEPSKRLHDYPHQLSGGMQQRVMIAMALSGRPKVLVADEPTTALDVTIQKQILDLFADLKRKFQMSIILITHNFGIIQGLADKVAVMFRGRLVEFGDSKAVLNTPKHPYTRALIDCVPRLGADRQRLKTIDYSAF
jgi:ABC-type dipeptide/oligopeptide/nickel transport system ATPase component